MQIETLGYVTLELAELSVSDGSLCGLENREGPRVRGGPDPPFWAILGGPKRVRVVDIIPPPLGGSPGPGALPGLQATEVPVGDKRSASN